MWISTKKKNWYRLTYDYAAACYTLHLCTVVYCFPYRLIFQSNRLSWIFNEKRKKTWHSIDEEIDYFFFKKTYCDTLNFKSWVNAVLRAPLKATISHERARALAITIQFRQNINHSLYRCRCYILTFEHNKNLHARITFVVHHRQKKKDI